MAETNPQTVAETVAPTVPATEPQTPAGDGAEGFDLDVSDFLVDAASVDDGDAGTDDAANDDAGLEPDGVASGPTDDGAAEDPDGLGTTPAGENAVEPAGDTADATPENPEAPSSSEPPTPATKKPTDAELQQQQQDAAALGQRYQAFNESYKTLKGLVESGKFDAYDHGEQLAKLNLEGMELIAHQLHDVQGFIGQQKAKTHVEDYWTKWGNENKDIGADTGRKVYAREYEAARTEFPDATPQELERLALRELGRNVRTRRAQQAAKKPGATGAAATPRTAATAARPAAPSRPGVPPTPRKTITPNGARPTPVAAGQARRAAAEADPEAMFIAEAGKGIKGFLDD